MLSGAKILVVEDEALIAFDLAGEVEDALGTVVGPAASVEQAFRLVEELPISGAILDANLADRDVTPLALHLAKKHVPFVVHTGTGLPAELSRACPDIVVVMKPARLRIVVDALSRMMG